MKRKFGRSLGTLYVLIFLSSMIITFPVYASATRIYLDPANYIFSTPSVSLGHKFNVTLKVDDVTDLSTFQVTIVYNDTIINVTRWYEPTWDPEYVFNGKTTLPIPYPPDFSYESVGPGVGSATVGSALFPAPPTQSPFTGNGTLCILEFEITAVPPEGETYSCDLNINNLDTFLLDSVGDEIPVTKENGYYELSSGVTPPPPTETRLYVDPPEIIDPTKIPCSTFTINITIDDVEDMSICGFNLTYDPDIIGWTGISILKVQGQMPSPSMDANDPAGYIWIRLIYATPVTTSDPIPLVTIQFHVDNYGATPLNLQGTEVLDSNSYPIDHEVGDGYFATQIRDVAIIDIVLSQNWTYQGQPININVTAKNLGNTNETFDVKTYYDANLIGTLHVSDLAPDAEIIVTFTWNASFAEPCHNYTISAEATKVPYELNVTNNVYVDGIVKVYFVGDINRDGYVDMIDIYIVIKAFGTIPGHLRYNPEADVDKNGKIDMIDIYTVIKNFPKSCVQ